MDLVGDLAVGDATTDDWLADVPVPASTLSAAGSPYGADTDGNLPPPPPEMLDAESAFTTAGDQSLADLRNNATDLRHRVAQSEDPALAGGVTDARLSPASDVGAFREGGDISDPPPIVIPEYARTQLRKEARFSIALQQNQRELFLANIISSEYGKVFIFQATTPIDVTESGSNEQCTLAGGDLIRFARIPAATDTSVSMRVVASRPGHCRASSTVELGVGDLQDMMNAFTERVEHEKMRMSACLAPGGACLRS
jgi:hypothetical protein